MASNLNFLAGEVRSQLAVTKIGTSGEIRVYNGSAQPVRVILDLQGYYVTRGAAELNGRQTAVRNARRISNKYLVGNATNVVTVADFSDAGPDDPGLGGVPEDVADHAIINIAVANPSNDGFLTVFQPGTARPPTSNLNYLSGTTTSNTMIAPLDQHGRVSIYTTHAVRIYVDVHGWITE